MPIYFIQAGDNGPVKIGFTKSIRSRFVKMQVDCPIPLRILHWIEGDRAQERAFHQRWDSARRHGEWFAPLPEIVAGDFEDVRLPVPRLSSRNLATLDAGFRRAPELDELFSRRGAVKAVAEGLNISTAAVSTWRYVPAKRRDAVAEILRVPVEAVPVRPARAA